MTLSSRFERLLQVRLLREEQLRLSLHQASVELEGLRHRLASVYADCNAASLRFMVGANSEDPTDRFSGIQERELFVRLAELLKNQITHVENRIHAEHKALVVAYTERRQSEVLIENSKIRKDQNDIRKSQKDSDDRHRIQYASSKKNVR